MTCQPKRVCQMADFEILTLFISLNSSQLCTYFGKDLVTGYFLKLVKDGLMLCEIRAYSRLSRGGDGSEQWINNTTSNKCIGKLITINDICIRRLKNSLNPNLDGGGGANLPPQLVF